MRDLGLVQRFLRLCAARSGQLLNLASLGADCGISAVTAREWLGVLEASYLVMRLPPYHRHFGKRLVKTPKLYFLDVGLMAWLLGIRDARTIMRVRARSSWVGGSSQVAPWGNEGSPAAPPLLTCTTQDSETARR